MGHFPSDIPYYPIKKPFIDIYELSLIIYIYIDIYIYNMYIPYDHHEASVSTTPIVQQIHGNSSILNWRYVNVPYFWPYFVGIFPEI